MTLDSDGVNSIRLPSHVLRMVAFVDPASYGDAFASSSTPTEFVRPPGSSTGFLDH